MFDARLNKCLIHLSFMHMFDACMFDGFILQYLLDTHKCRSPGEIFMSPPSSHRRKYD